MGSLFSKSQQNATERLTSALVTAIKTGSIERIEAALADGADINAADRDLQRTPLHHATYSLRDATEVISFLLSRGANPNVRDKDGHSPLHNAVRVSDMAVSGGVEAIALLIEHKACVDATNHQGLTPLHRAAMCFPAQLDVCAVFVRSGASMNTLNKYGDTPLHIAIRIGNLSLAEALIDNGADVNAREGDDGPTPLRNGRQGDSTAVYKLLVAEGGHV